MRISNMTREYIKDLLEVRAETTLCKEHAQECIKLANILDIPKRFAIEIKRIELVPDTRDIIVNIMVKHILDLYDAGEDPQNEENALWVYLNHRYNFDTDEHDYLLKATFEEAIYYAVQHIDLC